MNTTHIESVEPEAIPETTDVEHTLETQSELFQFPPRLSSSSISSLVSQTTLGLKSKEVAKLEIHPILTEPIQYSEIESKEKDLEELYTEEELYDFIYILKFHFDYV